MTTSPNQSLEYNSDKFRVNLSGEIFYKKETGEEAKIGRLVLESKIYNGEPDNYSVFDPEDSGIQGGSSTKQGACKLALDNYINNYTKRNKTADRLTSWVK